MGFLYSVKVSFQNSRSTWYEPSIFCSRTHEKHFNYLMKAILLIACIIKDLDLPWEPCRCPKVLTREPHGPARSLMSGYTSCFSSDRSQFKNDRFNSVNCTCNVDYTSSRIRYFPYFRLDRCWGSVVFFTTKEY